MENEKMSLAEVAAKADWEGLGYCIQHYMTGDSIADPVLAVKWDQCRQLMIEIEAMLPQEYADELNNEE